MAIRLKKLLRPLFFIFVRIGVTVLLGLNIRRRDLLPKTGPAIIIANHNSHLDTLVLQSLFPLNKLSNIKPVAAADYFSRTRHMAWFANNIINIIPIERSRVIKGADPLAGCYRALDNGNIIIIYPEGSRGEPERISHFKKGIAHLAERYPDVPVIPVFMHGLGKALPKGEIILVPFFCDIYIGEKIIFSGNRNEFMAKVTRSFEQLAAEGHFSEWE